MRNEVITYVFMILIAFASPLFSQEDSRPWDQQPYLGLAARDTEEGLVVAKVFPGPLSDSQNASKKLPQPGDTLVSLDGKTVDSDGLKAQVASKAPGASLVLVFRRSSPPAVANGDKGGEEFTLNVTLSNKDQWSGTIGRGLSGRVVGESGEGQFEAMILERARQAGIVATDGGVKALLENLRAVQQANLDSNSMPAVVQTFRRPLSIDAVESQVAAGVKQVNTIGTTFNETDLEQIAALLNQTLDLPTDENAFSKALSESAVNQAEWQAWDKAMKLVDQMRNDWSIQTPQAGDHISVIRMSKDAAGPLIGAHLRALLAEGYAWEIKTQTEALINRKPIPKDQIPPELSAAIQGDVMAFELDQNKNYRVLGGAGNNTYDMSKIASVVDISGNDRYDYPAIANNEPDSPTRNQSIVDLAGNDTYEAKGDFFGPATGVFGYSIIDDRSGNDVYISNGQMSIGAGLFGVGVLIDRGGDDKYSNKGPQAGFSMGVGYYGAGLIVDKAGQDTYLGEKLCQGMGGPRGFGAIIDTNGNDIYRANGPSFASAYGTGAVFLGMSQGFGFGIRGYAAGGVGAIYDFAGSDQYEAGEFSQAGGYYYGLGIMHDMAGNDLYFGNRYGQGFAAHQAAGILIDDAGDDTYWAKTAASQAGTWDQSIGMLVDRAGNDSYRCDALGQGGASMQAVAMFLDLDGDDRYSSNAGNALGQSGSNTYHYLQDKVFSFSLFLDKGDGVDSYSGGNHQPERINNTMFKTGSLDKEKPENSTLYGLFVDGNPESESAADKSGFREWTAKNGKFKVIARLVSAQGDSVELEKEDGTTVTVKLKILGAADQKYVREQE